MVETAQTPSLSTPPPPPHRQTSVPQETGGPAGAPAGMQMASCPGGAWPVLPPPARPARECGSAAASSEQRDVTAG